MYYVMRASAPSLHRVYRLSDIKCIHDKHYRNQLEKVQLHMYRQQMCVQLLLLHPPSMFTHSYIYKYKNHFMK